MKIDVHTSVPIGWVIALLLGCAGATGGAVKLGQYVGGKDAEGAETASRVTKLEARTVAIEGMESRIDRRLFRLELERHISVPESDRIPGVK